MLLSLRTTNKSSSNEPACAKASNAIPPVIAPSPITATCLDSEDSFPIAIPSIALIEVLECPTPNAS